MAKRRSRKVVSQTSLFGWEHPWTTLGRFSEGFFKGVPSAPGVYRFFGSRGELLYVGKAKRLRTRLRSYRNAKPGAVTRKVLRLLRRVVKIEWEITASEAHALLRENEILRTLKPPFNTVNKRPENYLFLGLKRIGSQTRFRLSSRLQAMVEEGEECFGAFKGRFAVREGTLALLRILFVLLPRPMGQRFEIPSKLTKDRPPREFVLTVEDGVFRRLKLFLAGRDRGFLAYLSQSLLDVEDVPTFAYTWIERDLQHVERLFDEVLAKHREIKRATGVRKRILEQAEVDDLMVHARFGLHPTRERNSE